MSLLSVTHMKHNYDLTDYCFYCAPASKQQVTNLEHGRRGALDTGDTGVSEVHPSTLLLGVGREEASGWYMAQHIG